MSLVQELCLIDLYENKNLKPLLTEPAVSLAYDIQTEELVDMFWKDGYHNLNELYTYNPQFRDQLLTEGAGDAVKRHAINLIQAAIGFGAEAGITVAGAGATAPAGVAAETAVDVAFASAQSAAAVSAMGNIKEGAEDAQEIWDSLSDITMEAGVESIFETVEGIVENAIALAEKLGKDITEFLTKIADKLKKVLNRVAGAAGDLISMLIPADAGVGGAAIQEIIVQAGSNGYSMIAKAYNAMPDMATEMVEQEGALEDFMDSIIELAVSFVDELGEEDVEAEKEEEGFWDKVKDTGLEVLKKVGRAYAFLLTAGISEAVLFGMRKYKGEIIEWLEGPVRSGLDGLAEAVRTIIPWIFACLAFLQILVNDGHLESEEDDEDGAGAGDGDGEAEKQEESRIRGHAKQIFEEYDLHIRQPT